MRRNLYALIHGLGFEVPPLPYCAKCGGHYPAHSH